MKVSTSTQVTVTLVLTAEEAKWLNGLMQNPLSDNCDPDREDPYDREMRKAFFEATSNAVQYSGSTVENK